MIEAAGESLLYLPPYSPDFDPIEKAFAKLNALLRKAGRANPRRRVGGNRPPPRPLHPPECRNYFAAAGYDAT